jgi:hypothetical protein
MLLTFNVFIEWKESFVVVVVTEYEAGGSLAM